MSGAPSYLARHRSGELTQRAEHALRLLAAPCRVCPRLCSVDRMADERGLCRIGRHAIVASHFPHFGEEDCLRGRPDAEELVRAYEIADELGLRRLDRRSRRQTVGAR